MININTRIIFPALALVVAGAYGATQASAHSFDGGIGQENIITRLAEKLGKSPEEVQVVFDEIRQERQAEHQKLMEEKLSTAVSDGKITEAQKQLIINKLQQLHEDRQEQIESLKDKSPEERRAAMKTHRDELQSWAKSNGIDLSLLDLKFGMFGKGGRGIGLHMTEFDEQ